MEIFVDTRNRTGKHPQDKELEDTFSCHLHKQALPVGDYCKVTTRFADMYDIRRHERYIKIKYKNAPSDSKINVNVLDLIGTYSVCVDVKSGIDELANNLLNTNSRYRFEREILRAKHDNIRLCILIGDDDYCTGQEAILSYHGKNRDNPIAGQAIIDKVDYYHRKYGTEFIICPKNRVAELIVKILNTEEIQ